MQDDLFTERVEELGQRIERKQRAIQEHGILQGDLREQAVETALEEDSQQRRAAARAGGRRLWSVVLVGEFGALKRLFDRWTASVDKGY